MSAFSLIVSASAGLDKNDGYEDSTESSNPSPFKGFELSYRVKISDLLAS